MIVLLKKYASPALLVAGLALAFGWYRGTIREAEARGETKVAHAQRDSVKAVYDSVAKIRAAKDRADSLVDAAERIRLANLARQLATVRDSTRRVTTALDSLRQLPATTAADTARLLRVALEATVTLRQEAGACQVRESGLESALALCRVGRLRAKAGGGWPVRSPCRGWRTSRRIGCRRGSSRPSTP